MNFYKCTGLEETEAHHWRGDFEIGKKYKGIEYGNKTLWINAKYVDADQFVEVDDISLIDSVEIAYSNMPLEFYANELIPKVYNPNNCNGGVILRSLRRLRKYKKINYKADNTGKYTKL